MQVHIKRSYKSDKKRSERRKHCVLAVVRQSQIFFTPLQTPSQGHGTAKI